MGRKLMMGAAVVASGGMLLGGGCFGNKFWKKLAWEGATFTAFEFVLDNDAIFDLFQDDFGTDVQYDDRFSADTIRVEPNDDAQNLIDGLVGRD